MYLTEREVIAQAQMRADRLAAAEQERVLSILRIVSHESHTPRYAGLLIWIGSRLETWGCHLQTRYAVSSSRISPEALPSEGGGC